MSQQPAHIEANRIAVIANAASGAFLDRPDAPGTLPDLLGSAGFDVDFISPDAGSLPERVALACASGAGMVVVAGGDGSVACAAQQIAGTGIVLGILPFGTANVLARDLDIPIGDLAAAVAVLRDGKVREIDAAEVNGRLYLCASMLGLPARLARYREMGRGKGSMTRLWSRFARAAFRAFARYQAPRVALTLDGRFVELRAGAIMITPNLLDDSTGRRLGRDRLDEGRLGLYALKQINLRAILRLLVRLLLRIIRRDPDFHGAAAREITILRMGRRAPRTIRVMNDGEVTLMAPPLTYRIVPRAIRVMAPAESA
ncbi:MAG TPA: diacylglycerol kinase family protein [Alphaproteobacteria bacterium]|nr:diacylglycerol kinase family protein [Alphaproteobacteria bacterium]